MCCECRVPAGCELALAYASPLLLLALKEQHFVLPSVLSRALNCEPCQQRHCLGVRRAGIFQETISNFDLFSELKCLRKEVASLAGRSALRVYRETETASELGRDGTSWFRDGEEMQANPQLWQSQALPCEQNQICGLVF